MAIPMTTEVPTPTRVLHHQQGNSVQCCKMTYFNRKVLDILLQQQQNLEVKLNLLLLLCCVIKKVTQYSIAKWDILIEKFQIIYYNKNRYSVKLNILNLDCHM